jgi:hypothetical protein
MKILMLRNTMTSAGNARSGDVVDVPDDEANLFIKMNRASVFIETPVIEQVDRSIGLKLSDIKPSKRGRRKIKEDKDAS